MRKSNVALRLQPALLEEARRVAESEGVALNHLINVAVAEKLSALRTEDYFRERAARGNINKAKTVLRRAGKGNPPLPATSSNLLASFGHRCGLRKLRKATLEADHPTQPHCQVNTVIAPDRSTVLR